MWMPKGCTRCGGDLYQSTTEDGQVLSCLQCGREFLAQPRRPMMSDDEVYALFHEHEAARRLAA
jgi:predicted  nucleic acid-binding Zn-ribbon protein